MTQAAVTSSDTPQVTASQVLDGQATQAPPPEKVAPPADDRVSPKLQVLLQRERTAIEREKSAKAMIAAAEAREKQWAERERKILDFESIKATNPRKALELLGMSYQDLTQVELADGDITPDIKVKRLEDKFNSFTKSQEEALQRQEENARIEYEKKQAQTIDTFKGEISSYLKDNSARYELIEFEQSHDLVYGVIDEHYERTRLEKVAKAEEDGEATDDILGDVMTIAQAADKVEAHLEAKYDKARGLSKVKTLLGPRQEKPAEKPTPTPSQQPKTLNNTLSAAQSAPKPTRPLTDEERVAKAIAYARGLRP